MAQAVKPKAGSGPDGAEDRGRTAAASGPTETVARPIQPKAGKKAGKAATKKTTKRAAKKSRKAAKRKPRKQFF